MSTVYIDSKVSDDMRRQRLYGGELFVFSPRPTTIALCEFAKAMLQEAFGGVDPLEAQHQMPVEQYVAIVSPLKPRFIHHPETKRLLRELVAGFGCDLEDTYVDVPRLRMVTSHGYLTAGVGYAHHLHRDTWYSAPMAQLNWWLPIYEFESESSMAFHPNYWAKAVKNGSGGFNYYEWNSEGRKNAAQHIKTDTRKQPKPEEDLEIDPQVRIVCPPGGVILFSAAHMHSTVPNTAGRTRYSIDFRTVNLADLHAGNAPPNVDSHSVGTSLRDFVRGSDAATMPDEIVKRYDNAPATEGVLVYRPVTQ
jgi:hypothetical protein